MLGVNLATTTVSSTTATYWFLFMLGIFWTQLNLFEAIQTIFFKLRLSMFSPFENCSTMTPLQV